MNNFWLVASASAPFICAYLIHREFGRNDNLVGLVFMLSWFVWLAGGLGWSDMNEAERRADHYKYCKDIKNGYICKFPEEIEQPEQDSCNRSMGRYSDC